MRGSTLWSVLGISHILVNKSRKDIHAYLTELMNWHVQLTLLICRGAVLH